MVIQVTPIRFLEIILGTVTMVWTGSFVVQLVIPSYDGASYNNLFMVVAGILTSAITAANKSRKTNSGNGDNKNDYTV